jgi:hypothetical protein
LPRRFLFHGDAVAAGVLAALEEVFEAADEHLHSVERVDGRRSGGDGDADLIRADLDGSPFDERSATFGNVAEVIDGGVWNQDEELIHRPTAKDLRIAQRIRHGLCDGAQGLIADGVSVVLVDDAQVIDIGENRSKKQAVLPEILDRLKQFDLKIATVSQVAQGVEEAAALQIFHSLASLFLATSLDEHLDGANDLALAVAYGCDPYAYWHTVALFVVEVKLALVGNAAFDGSHQRTFSEAELRSGLVDVIQDVVWQ